MAFGAPRGVSGAKASIFRQWLSNLKVEQESGSPALASVCLERRQSAPQLALKVLRILCEGEVSEGESLARMLVSLSATCKGDGQQQQQQQQQQFSLAHFLLMGEDEGKPSLLRLLLLANEDGVALIPASLRTAVAERLLAPDTRLEGVSQALRHWIRENNLASAGFPDMVRVAYEFLAEICVEMAMPDSGDTAEAEAIRLVLLGNGTTVEPLHRVLLWRDESGLFEILTLLAAGFVVGLELQMASPGQQHVLLRRWQERFSRAGELLEETAHAPFAWAQTAIRTARALGPGGVLETRFVEISIAMASSSEPVHARAERAAQALFAGLDKDPVLAAQWDAHLASVMREVSSPGMGIVLDAARSRAWPAAARAIQALPGNFSLSGFAQQVEDLATYMMDALRT
ncbi:Hypothetical Protein FCC1311_004602 [Hondaea fermentalgiana]|uniref:Uncharacterized protein n=1 Tax=Hondaea fermentalgiana TaxID=2315210 RepID=A0A2R5FZQ4_9STRA|nr:Hypothetical Protein FCC1311_004602 [Hondaea fermentalgiana]|eukprot:GBG24242.1 Hypothetical Protein FCC1311_004602 [Hondaea fermentalgiana]